VTGYQEALFDLARGRLAQSVSTRLMLLPGTSSVRIFGVRPGSSNMGLWADSSNELREDGWRDACPVATGHGQVR
jgi:hypothetical protein